MLIRAFIFIIAFVLMGIYWVIPNEALMARITGESARGSEFSSFETMGSGRGGLAIDSLQIFSEANLGEKIFGVGETEQLERMMAIRGKKVVPHNGYLTVLLNQGLFGLTIYLWFLFRAWNASGKLASRDDIVFIRSILIAYILMAYLQTHNSTYILIVFIFAYAWKVNSPKVLSRLSTDVRMESKT